MLPPIVIDVHRPRTPTGRFPAKVTVGEVVPVEVTLLKDGHDLLGGALRWSGPSGAGGMAPLLATGDGDRWRAELVAHEPGAHVLAVMAWTDHYATWCRDVVKRVAAGQDVGVELEVGARHLDHLAARAADQGAAQRLANAAAGLRRASCTTEVRLSAGLDDAVVATAATIQPAWDRSEVSVALWADRQAAGSAAWYELFPRSYGGFRGVIAELPRLAALGFDVLYLPPVHPIGRSHRKGPNNTLHAGPDDVGSPWAIGSAAGGHTALHTDLGGEADFAALIQAAATHGIEIALDYALQCSPDHPWVAAHPEWFSQLPDGSIRYAENPPKKYQDIYPINFWPEREADRQALWDTCRDVLLHWIDRGVRIFRVDNPHTKPLSFWHWVIADVQRDHPDVIFLAEAFTAPAMMAKLAEVGFTQGYTYFTWRNTKAELIEYLEELRSAPLVDTMRPSFWPNTPDILEGVLRDGPLSAFAMRLVLAATLSPNYGIYSGFELGENAPASPDNTEYLDSEKYQLVTRDFGRQPNLNALIGAVNASRRRHPALRGLRNLRFHGSDNDAILVYSKTAPGPAPDVVLVVVNLDPHHAQAATLDLDLGALGLGWDEPLDAIDELIDTTFAWQGPHPWVRLDPASQPAHLLHLRPRSPR